MKVNPTMTLLIFSQSDHLVIANSPSMILACQYYFLSLCAMWKIPDLQWLQVQLFNLTVVQKLAIISTTLTRGNLSEPRRQGIGWVQPLRDEEAGSGVGTVSWVWGIRSESCHLFNFLPDSYSGKQWTLRRYIQIWVLISSQTGETRSIPLLWCWQ